MHQSTVYGKLLINGSKPDHKLIIKMLRTHHRTYYMALKELLKNGVLREEDGIVVCPRMVKDEALREVRRTAGRLGGNPVLLNQDLNRGGYHRVPPPSSSSSSSLVPSPSSSPTPPPKSKSPRGSSTRVEPPDDGSPQVEILPLNTGKEYTVREKQVGEWGRLYPAVNIGQELKNMRGWLLANPTKRKTSRGILRFINSWLAKRQDSGGGKSGPGGGPGGKDGSGGSFWFDREQRAKEVTLENVKKWAKEEGDDS